MANGVRRRIAKKGTNGRRSRADKVLAQGTGKAVSRPFGSRQRAVGLEGWDAFSPAHLPLPRSVAPYTVVKTTSLLTSSARVNIFGSFARTINTEDNKSRWSLYGALFSVNSANPINAASNTRLEPIPFPGVPVTGTGITAVPSAISVQVMNPNPLQTTEGIVAGAVCKTQLDLRGRTETWAEFGSEFISFMRPRLMSAGKLALRGVQLDAVPLNMNALSDFRPLSSSGAADVTWDTSQSHYPEGWSPIVIINNGSSETPPLSLNYLVTVEWRVRFDIGNPAVSSHTHHGVTSDAHWDNLIKAAESRAHGAMDIVERVASAGAAAANTAARVAAAARYITGPPATPMITAG